MITEQSIRERLAADRAKVSRLASWEEVEFLLEKLATERTQHAVEIRDIERDCRAEVDEVRHEMAEALREAGADFRAMEQEVARAEQAAERW